jgi:myo-inositol-1(or 4)-monophosphatase
MLDYISTCERAARAAGDVLLQWRGRFSVREKGRADLVTEADEAAQHVAQQVLRAEYPDFAFVGEESPGSAHWRPTAGEASEFCWIVDPLDGTTNYVHGLPGWCVSVALARGAALLAGCVYDPVSENCYTAIAGEGACRDGQPLHVSRAQTLSESLVAISMPASTHRDSLEVSCFLEMLPRVRAFRRMGSAALNLCYLAAGQLDAYWATSVHAWDVAAGVLLLREAGGVVSDLTGQPYRLDHRALVAAASSGVHEELVQLMRNAVRPAPGKAN